MTGFKTFLLAATALTASTTLAPYALASLGHFGPSTAEASASSMTCGPAVVDDGEGKSGVVSTYVSGNNHHWVVRHTLASGQVINRADQYDMQDAGNAELNGWAGASKRHPNLTMIGNVRRVRGQWSYFEFLFDVAKSNKMVMHSVAICRINTAPNVTSGDSVGDSVVLLPGDAGLWLVVRLGGLSTSMILDTGSSTVSVTGSTAEALAVNGDATWTGDTVVTLADGSQRAERTLMIHRLELGSHVAYDVSATVGPEGSSPLLGMSALRQLGPFTINADAGTLSFN